MMSDDESPPSAVAGGPVGVPGLPPRKRRRAAPRLRRVKKSKNPQRVTACRKPTLKTMVQDGSWTWSRKVEAVARIEKEIYEIHRRWDQYANIYNPRGPLLKRRVQVNYGQQTSRDWIVERFITRKRRLNAEMLELVRARHRPPSVNDNAFWCLLACLRRRHPDLPEELRRGIWGWYFRFQYAHAPLRFADPHAGTWVGMLCPRLAPRADGNDEAEDDVDPHALLGAFRCLPCWDPLCDDKTYGSIAHGVSKLAYENWLVRHWDRDHQLAGHAPVDFWTYVGRAPTCPHRAVLPRSRSRFWDEDVCTDCRAIVRRTDTGYDLWDDSFLL